MPTLIDTGSWKIRMYFGDHNPPHFHLICRDGSASMIALDDLRVLKGDAPTKALEEARQWAEANRDELTNAWNAGR